MDRLTGLTVFTRVVEAGGFSAAARRLGMSTTMVSNHVQALEDRLDARLLHRTTRKVSLTEIGRAYYDRAVVILADLEDADRIASAEQAAPRGTLRLHTSTHIVRFLSPVVRDYLALYPGVTVDLSIGERMVDLIEEGFDLAIRTLPPPDSSLIVRRLTPWRHVLCCAPAYREAHPEVRAPADLAGHNCLRYSLYPYGDEWRFDAPDGRLTTVRVSGNAVANSAELLRRLALAGSGVMLAPSFVAADDLAAGRLVRMMPAYRPVEFAISAVYPHRHHLSSKVRRFLDILAERFAEHRQWMNPPATMPEG